VKKVFRSRQNSVSLSIARNCSIGRPRQREESASRYKKAQTLSAFLAPPAPKAGRRSFDFISPDACRREDLIAVLQHPKLRAAISARQILPRQNSWRVSPESASVRESNGCQQALAGMRRQAVEQGVADAWADFGELEKQFAAGKVTSGMSRHAAIFEEQLFIPQAAAVLGIYGIQRRRRCIRFMPWMRRSRS